MFHKVAFYLQLSCLSLFNCLVVSAATPSLDRAIEKSAELPALSQHLAKVYVSLCNNIKEPSFYQERDAVIQTFDENMHELGRFVPNDAIKAKIQKVRSIWQEYKTIANWTIHKEGASKLLKLSAEILEATNLLYQEYQNYAQEKRSIKAHKTEIRINAALQDNRNISILMYRIMLYYLAEKQGIDNFSMFSITPLGIIFVATTFIYMLTIGRKLLPTRLTLATLIQNQQSREFITHAFVQKGSELDGISF